MRNFEKTLIAVTVLGGLFYSPHILSGIMRVCGLEKYWVVFWGISYSLYAVAGIIFARIFSSSQDMFLAVVAVVILGVQLLVSRSLNANYFLSHAFYGLVVLAITISICRDGEIGGKRPR